MTNIPAPVTDKVTLLDPELAPGYAVALGLTLDEYQSIVDIQDRVPSLVELYMYSLMWSEHCSYKHSKKQLRNFSSEGEHVLQGPGENAGVISVGDGWAVAFKMESHNHPSAYDPFAGAATGVGGCVRDIFTMGARPIASLGSLRFGTLDKQRQRELLTGAVAGIGSYGDGLGVPTVGGEVYFEEAYEGNCLINAMCIGLMREEDLTRAVGSGPGNYVVLIGAPTGRDGIGGASVMASQEFNEKDDDKVHSVPQGDPALEKQIIEACLELLKRDQIVALGDLGAAGLTSSASEMASRGGVGIEIDVSKVPVCEEAMQPFEIMVAESQERMLAVVQPDDYAAVEEICGRWGVTCTQVGQITDTGRFVVRDSTLPVGEDIVADIPAEMLANSAPEYDPKSERPAYLDKLQNYFELLAAEGEPDFVYSTAADPVFLHDVLAERGLAGCAHDHNLPNRASRSYVAGSTEDKGCSPHYFAPFNEVLNVLLASPNICSRQWIWDQCDAEVQGNTIITPGADAAVLRIGGAESTRGIATSTDCNGRYCYLDPYLGAQLALAEASRNLACVGAKPAAITDCLNFGNPEKPEVFYTFEQAVKGLADACRFFKIPVISGNVSFYNESFGSAIYPTPAIGIVGVLDDITQTCTPAFKQEGDIVILVGETSDELGGSEYLKVVHGLVAGRPPALDLELEAAVQAAVRTAVCAGLVASAHDCSEGGLAVALAESCVAGDLGASVVLDDELPPVASLFAESASRILVSVRPEKIEAFLDILVGLDVPYSIIGEVGGTLLAIDAFVEDKQMVVVKVKLDSLKTSYLETLEKLVQQ